MSRISRRKLLGLGLSLPVAAALTQQASAAAATHTVTIRGMSFKPAKLAIKVGDTVVFHNKGGASHTADDKGKAWKTGNINAGQSKSVVYTTAGSFNYICRYHPSMRGTITVNA